jgi:hypothetical protein
MLNNKSLLALLIVSYLIVLSQSALGIRITPASIQIDFSPNYDEVFTFYTEKSDYNKAYIEGDLTEYISITENRIAKDGSFKVRVNLPTEIESPGTKTAYIGVIEGGSGGGTVSGIAAIRSPIRVKVPFPGYFAEVSLHTRDLNINETAAFYVNINNLGKLNITNARSTISILNLEGAIVETLTTGTKKINVNSAENIESIFDASKHSPGIYSAVAQVEYGDLDKELESKFKIGTLKLRLLNYSDKLEADKINKFELVFESEWNSKIENAFAQIIIFNNSDEITSIRTASFDLLPWERKSISSFLDLRGVNEGEYNVEISLLYGGKTEIISGHVDIIPVNRDLSLSRFFNSTNILIGVTILLVILNIILLKRNSKSRMHKRVRKKSR